MISVFCVRTHEPSLYFLAHQRSIASCYKVLTVWSFWLHVICLFKFLGGFQKVSCNCCVVGEKLVVGFLMVPKRHFHEGGEDFEFPVPESKRRSTFKNVARDVMKDLPLNEQKFEHFFRRVVREELERIIPYLKASPRPSLQNGSTSGGRGLQLQFINKLPSTIFTGSRVDAEDGTPLQIVLIDASTQTIVSSGPLSSLKIELLAVNGEFGSDDQEDWTEKEFNNYVVRERVGKRPLVTGEINMSLREGMASLSDIVFTDNSSWIRSRKFRLAARAVPKNPSEVRIREAKSEPFVVKDHRGELYRKHYPPSLSDEIWRLEKIAKEGAFHNRLSQNGINTVKDFLQSFVKDPSSLRSIFGGISNKTWKAIIQHATTCDMVPVDVSSLLGLSRPLESLQAEPFNGANPDVQHFQLAQDEPTMQLGFNHLSTSTSYPYQAEGSNQLVVSLGQSSHPMQVFSMEDLSTIHYNGESSWPLTGLQGPIVPSGHLGTENLFPVHASTWSPPTAIWGQASEFFCGSSSGTEPGHFPHIKKPKACWCKIRAAIKWWVSVRQNVAARRMARPLYLNY